MPLFELVSLNLQIKWNNRTFWRNFEGELNTNNHGFNHSLTYSTCEHSMYTNQTIYRVYNSISFRPFSGSFLLTSFSLWCFFYVLSLTHKTSFRLESIWVQNKKFQLRQHDIHTYLKMLERVDVKRNNISTNENGMLVPFNFLSNVTKNLKLQPFILCHSKFILRLQKYAIAISKMLKFLQQQLNWLSFRRCVVV